MSSQNLNSRYLQTPGCNVYMFSHMETQVNNCIYDFQDSIGYLVEYKVFIYHDQMSFLGSPEINIFFSLCISECTSENSNPVFIP